MAKRALTFSLIVFLIFVSTCFPAQSQESVANHSGDNGAMSLEQAIELGVEHSLERQRLLIELERLQIELDDLRSDPNLYLPWNLPRLELLRLRNQQRIALLRSLRLVEERVSATIEEQFQNMLVMDRQLTIQESGLSTLEEKLALESRRLGAGLSTELAVELMTISLEHTVWNLQRFRDTVSQATMQFNLLIGQELQAPLLLAGVVDTSISDLDINSSLEGLKTTEFGALFEQRRSYEEARQRYSDIYSPAHDTHGVGAQLDSVRRARLDALQAELEYTNRLRQAEIGLWGRYRDVSSAQQAVALALRELEFERKRLNLEERRFTLGLVTHMTVVEQLNRVTSREVEYYNKIAQYQKALIHYRLAEKGI